MHAFTITPVRSLLGAAVLAATLLAHPASAAPQTKSPDEPLLIARDAFRSGDRAKLMKAAEKLKGHVLAPYAEYWQLRMRLDEAPAEEVYEFIGRNSGALVAEQLRLDRLRMLGKRARWDLFRDEYQSVASDDPELACYALQARYQQGDQLALVEVLNYWNAPQELPAACSPLAETMLRSGQLTERHVRERIRLLAGRNAVSAAKRLLVWLPRDQAFDGARLEKAVQSPVKLLERPVSELKKPAGRELAIVALSRLAQSEPQTAANYWDRKLREHYPHEDQGYVWAMLGMQGARSHLPESLYWFRAAGDTLMTDDQLGWRVRIALRQYNWAEVKATIERMSLLARNEPAWIYWLGRAHAALGAENEARALYTRLAPEHHFYGRLAAEELGLALEIPPKAPALTAEEIEGIGSMPGLQRALALHRLGMRTEAVREWIWSIRGMDDRMLLAAAELARRNEMWDRAINTADKTVEAHDFSVRYMTPYREVLSEQARAQKLDESWVLGLVRQESRFIADARSSAGAAGLMQLMPATARWVARKLGIKNVSPSRFSDPGMNAAMGTFYLKHVLDELEGNPVLAAAAYNAGPGRARKWRDVRPLEGAIYAESIPFKETRDYVKKVMVNTMYYSALLDGDARSLKARLGTIAARRGADGVVAQGEAAEQ